MRRPEQALEFLAKADRLAREIYEPTSAELIPARAALGLAWLEMRNRTEALRLLAETESIHKSNQRLGKQLEAEFQELRKALRRSG
jgi:hypothetical protein